VELFASITQPASAKGVAGSDTQATPGSTGVTYRVQVARAAARQLIEQLPEAVAVACVEFLYGPLALSIRVVEWVSNRLPNHCGSTRSQCAISKGTRQATAHLRV
jgi:hypothetical protein